MFWHDVHVSVCQQTQCDCNSLFNSSFLALYMHKKVLSITFLHGTLNLGFALLHKYLNPGFSTKLKGNSSITIIIQVASTQFSCVQFLMTTLGASFPSLVKTCWSSSKLVLPGYPLQTCSMCLLSELVPLPLESQAKLVEQYLHWALLVCPSIFSSSLTISISGSSYLVKWSQTHDLSHEAFEVAVEVEIVDLPLSLSLCLTLFLTSICCLMCWSCNFSINRSRNLSTNSTWTGMSGIRSHEL